MAIRVKEARNLRTERRANSPKTQVAASTVAVVLNNFSAVVAPTVNDDGAHGYSEGSLWINTATDTGYVCVDGASGAAIWKVIT
jgi:hypothetical protein